MNRLRIILPLCLIGSAATAEQTMSDLLAAAQAIEDQLSLANSLSGSIHGYGHSTYVVEDGVTDAALINQTMVNAYNAAIDGAAAKSFHMRFQALDISVEGKTPKQVFAVLKKWRDAGKFRGGLGLYRTFVHIDTRGSDATWGE